MMIAGVPAVWRRCLIPMEGKMIRLAYACASAVVVAVSAPVQAMTFSLTPVTNTTPNFAGPILIQGSITMGVGETMLSPTLMSTVNLPFLSNFSAGFNGSAQTWDTGFLAWNGVGSYTGAIYSHQISANNLGFSGGMPIGLYGSNPLGPGGLASIRLHFTDAGGQTQFVDSSYAINVVPTPGAATLLGAGALVITRRRRSGAA
jgi:hypothetical protein